MLRVTLCPNITIAVAGRAADLYREARGALTDEAWAELDKEKEFPTSLHCTFMSMCFDAASFFQVSMGMHWCSVKCICGSIQELRRQIMHSAARQR